MPSTLNPNDRLKKVIQTTLDELEAGLISERTNAALKAAKARGVRLGRHGAEVLAPKFKEEARQRAKDLKPVVTELKGRGLSLAKIAGELDTSKNSRAANSACLFGRLDSGLFPVRFLNVRNGEGHR